MAGMKSLCHAALAFLFVLAGCGGGGSGDQVEVRPFVVLTNFGSVPMLVPGVSYRLTMDSGDRLELNASPAGMQWIVTSDGNVVEAEASEDGAHWSARLDSPKGGQVVIQARSSTDPAQEATLTVVVNPQRHARRDAVANELRVWRETQTRRDGSQAVATVRATVTQVQADGRHQVEYRDISTPPGTPTETRTLDADANRLARSFPDGTVCTYTPVRELLDFPLHYGKSWSSDWQYECQHNGTPGYRETAHAATTVDGYESVTVPQGTHQALRLTTRVALTQSNDANLVLGAQGNAAYAQDIVCWWSVSLQRTVKCRVKYEYVGSAPAHYADTFVQELLEAR